MIDNKTIRKVIMLNKCLKGGSPTYENREASGAVANFTTNVVKPFVSLDCEILPIQEGSGTPSPSNPRPISGTSVLDIYHSGADTSDYDTTSVTLGQEIMGGTAEVVGGTGSATWVRKKIRELGSFTRYSNFFNVNISGTGFDSSADYLCEVFNNVGLKYDSTMTQQPEFSLGYSGNSLKFRYDSTTDPTQFLNDVGDYYIVHKLATPTDFTFTGQPIRSLLGVNNVWTDSGDTKVTYKYKTGEGGSSTKKYLPIFYDLYGKGCRHL